MSERKRHRSSSTIGTPRGRRVNTPASSSNMFDEGMKYVSRYVCAMIVVHVILAAFFMASLDRRNKNYMVSSLKSLKNVVDREYEWFAERLERDSQEEEEDEITTKHGHKNGKRGTKDSRHFGTYDDDDDDDVDDINKSRVREKWTMSSLERYFMLFCMYALHAASGFISTLQLAVMPVGVMNGVLDHGIYSKTEEIASASLVSILTMFVTLPINLFQILASYVARPLEALFRDFALLGNSDAVIALSHLCANIIVMLALRFVGRPIYGLVWSILPHPLTCICPCIPRKIVNLCCCCFCCSTDEHDSEQRRTDKEDSSTEDELTLTPTAPSFEHPLPVYKPTPVIVPSPSRGNSIDRYLRRQD